MEEIKIARRMESKVRRIRRLVETPMFARAVSKAEPGSSIKMIEAGDIIGLKDWVYNNNPLVDAPIRWLRAWASKERIVNYSRMTKAKLVNELTGKFESSTEDDATTVTRFRYTSPSVEHYTEGVQDKDASDSI